MKPMNTMFTSKGKSSEHEKQLAQEDKNARTSHQQLKHEGQKKLSLFGDRISRAADRNERIRDSFDSMEQDALDFEDGITKSPSL